MQASRQASRQALGRQSVGAMPWRGLFLAAEGAALEATFKLVNQSKSVMSCNFRHSDILFVCSSQEGDHYDGI